MSALSFCAVRGERMSVYKTHTLILEKYPTLSRVRRCTRASRSKPFCVCPGNFLLACWRGPQKRLLRRFSAPEPVTKWGKVLISHITFC